MYITSRTRTRGTFNHSAGRPVTLWDEAKVTSGWVSDSTDQEDPQTFNSARKYSHWRRKSEWQKWKSLTGLAGRSQNKQDVWFFPSNINFAAAFMGLFFKCDGSAWMWGGWRGGVTAASTDLSVFRPEWLQTGQKITCLLGQLSLH